MTPDTGTIPEKPIVNLGFPYSDFESSEVHRSKVPSKIGGKPAWLHPHKLPTDLKCRKCGSCLIFLLQIYAPRIQVLDAHRMNYLFACWICGEDVRVYRSIVIDDSLLSEEYDSAISSQCCSICLLPNETRDVAATDSIVTPTNDHQRCLNGLKYGSDATSGMLAESILEIETEEEIDSSDFANRDKFADVDEKTLLATMTKYSGHVVRYGGGCPVWFSDKDQIMEQDIPICGKCGSQRTFEFQVQSTLLDAAGYKITANLELAFGVLCVYTCAKDCFSTDNDAPTYVEEFVHKQKDKTLSYKRFDK